MTKYKGGVFSAARIEHLCRTFRQACAQFAAVFAERNGEDDHVYTAGRPCMPAWLERGAMPHSRPLHQRERFGARFILARGPTTVATVGVLTGVSQRRPALSHQRLV